MRESAEVCEDCSAPHSDLISIFISYLISMVAEGRNFDQNRVGGSDKGIREQLGQQKTRDPVGVSKQVIR